MMLKRVFLSVCFVLWAGASPAFFPTPPEVADRVQTNFGSLDSYQVQLAANGTMAVGQSINFWSDSGRWRREWVRETNGTATLQRVDVGDGARLYGTLPRERTLPAPLLVLLHRTNLRSWWKELGIDTGHKRYAFIGQRPCLVLGDASAGQGRRTEIWIDFERWLPLRLAWGNGGSARFARYRNVGNFLLPHKIVVDDGSGQHCRFSLQWQGVNTQLPPRLFNASRLQAEYGTASFPSQPPYLLQWLRGVLPLVAR